jgi:hypothetical protein
MLRHKTRPVDPSLLKKAPDLSVRSAFVQQLTRERQAPLVNTRVVKVPLKRTRNGIYAGALPADMTEIAGEYKVTVSYNGERADRVQSRSVRLRPGPVDHRKSFAHLLQIESAGRPAWLLRIHLMDSAGNAITDRMEVRQIEASIRGAIAGQHIRPEPGFDGVFEQQLRVAPKKQPLLSAVSVRGKPIRITGGGRERDDGT